MTTDQYDALLRDIPIDIIKALSEKHVNRYQSRINRALAGERGYKLPELSMLLSLWEGIISKNYDVIKMTEPEKSELCDALADEGIL